MASSGDTASGRLKRKGSEPKNTAAAMPYAPPFKYARCGPGAPELNRRREIAVQYEPRLAEFLRGCSDAYAPAIHVQMSATMAAASTGNPRAGRGNESGV